MLCILSVVFGLVFCNVAYAIRRFDSPPIVHHDSRSSPSYIPLEVMNPLNQARSSSYSFVDTSGGLREQKIPVRLESLHRGHDYPVDRRRKKPRRRPQFEVNPSTRGFHNSRRVSPESIPSWNLPYGPNRSGAGVNEAFDGRHSRGKHYGEGGGGKFRQVHDSRNGAKARHGFKKQNSYDEAEKKIRDREENRAVHKEKEGHKRGHAEKEKHFGKHYSGREGEKGFSAKKKSGYEKNYKKTGFRKVHNKSEYKLDEEFYEKSRDGKDHLQRVSEHEKHAKEKAGAVKKSNHDSSHKEGHHEKEALQDKSVQREEKVGHERKTGAQTHQDKHTESDKNSDIEEGSQHSRTKDSDSDGGFFDFDNFF